MTADTAQLSRPERRRLLERLDELDVIDREMRRPGTLAATCEPPPLHRQANTKFTASSVTAERTAP